MNSENVSGVSVQDTTTLARRRAEQGVARCDYIHRQYVSGGHGAPRRTLRVGARWPSHGPSGGHVAAVCGTRTRTAQGSCEMFTWRCAMVSLAACTAFVLPHYCSPSLICFEIVSPPNYACVQYVCLLEVRTGEHMYLYTHRRLTTNLIFCYYAPSY